MAKGLYYYLTGRRRPQIDDDDAPPKNEEQPKNETGIIKVVVRFPKPPPQPRDPRQLPAVFVVGFEIVLAVDDFFTLNALSRTCSTFHDIVNRCAAHRNALFDRMEVPNPTPLRNIFEFSYSTGMCRRYGNELSRRTRGIYSRSGMDASFNEQAESTDVVQYGRITFEDALQPMYLPCYGCRRWKGSTQFLLHHQAKHLVLLGCRYELRRCIDCEFARSQEPDKRPETVEDWVSADEIAAEVNRRTRMVLGRDRLYLIDMPKGYRGFRQHCQVCHVAKWARVRPTKTREIRQVCEGCYQKGLSSPKVHRVNFKKKITASLSGDEIEDKTGAGSSSSDESGEGSGVDDDDGSLTDFDDHFGGFGYDVLRDDG